MTETRIRFRIGEIGDAQKRQKIEAVVNIALAKYIHPEWYQLARNHVNEIIFRDQRHYDFFQSSLLYLLAQEGIKVRIETGTETSQLPYKKLLGQS